MNTVFRYKDKIYFFYRQGSIPLDIQEAIVSIEKGMDPDFPFDVLPEHTTVYTTILTAMTGERVRLVTDKPLPETDARLLSASVEDDPWL